MTGLRFLFRVTLRRLDLAAEIYHIREPQKIPQVISPDEARRLLAVADSLRTRVLLSLAYGCGLRAREVVRLKVKHIDSAQKIIRIEQSKGRKDRNVMLSPETLDLLRGWWKERPKRGDAGTPLEERWLFPSRKSGWGASKPMTTRQLARLFHEAADAAGIRKNVTLHVHVVGHQVPFLDQTFLAPGKLAEYSAQVPPDLPKQRFLAVFGREHDLVLALPCRVVQVIMIL